MKTKIASSRIAFLSLFLSGLTILSSSTIAQSADDLSLAAQSSARVSFVPRSDNPSPARTQSGASRYKLPGICDGLPVLPENRLGLTSTSSPSLFVYFSEGTTVEKARLTLKSLDEEESEYYETVVTLPHEALSESGGVVAFEIPEIEAELALNEEYAWSLILMCEGELRPDSPVLSGFLKRVDDTEIARMKSDSLVETAIAYGDAGIWHDLLSTLAIMRSDSSGREGFEQHWSNVMESVGLDVIADEPLISEF